MHRRFRSRSSPPVIAGVRFLAIAWACLTLSSTLSAQTQPREGIQQRTPREYLLTGARVYVTPTNVLESAAIHVADGIIVAVGSDVTAPASAVRIDLSGHSVTAGWIDLDVRIDLPKAAADAKRDGRAWNDKIQPEREVGPGIVLDPKLASDYRKVGFTSLLVAPKGGIVSGAGRLMSTGDDARKALISERAVMFGGLEYGGWGDDTYPGSLMGAIALFRQTMFDARWYRESWQEYDAGRLDRRPEFNASLRSLGPVVDRRQRVALRGRNVYELLALGRIASEHNLDAWYIGSGDEYQWLGEVAAMKAPIVLPVNFPKAPKVDGIDGGRGVSLRRLEGWLRAPENAIRLGRSGVEWALTANGLDNKSDFFDRIATMQGRGLTPEQALAALTTTPAKLLGLDSRLGTIAAKKLAALTVFKGQPFAKDSKVVEVWIDGKRYPNTPIESADVAGVWNATLDVAGEQSTAVIELTGSGRRVRATFKRGDDEVKGVKVAVDLDQVAVVLPKDAFGGKERVTLLGSTHEGQLSAYGRDLDGRRIAMSATRDPNAKPTEQRNRRGGRRDRGERDSADAGDTAKDEDADRDDDANKVDKDAQSDEKRFAGSADEPIPVPLGARGRLGSPNHPAQLLIKGGTVWTSGPEGIIENCDVLIAGGKIVAVGRDLEADSSVEVLDAHGKHVTPGLIDAHSHTAVIGSVNEGTQAVSAEVRIGDVIRADDISIYRQLAGGVTAVQILHGSANPIGGQSAIVKWRWGQDGQALKIKDAPGTIKFALGENVKQSNWGDDATTRYPQTRMGVEQIMRDAFIAARAYAEKWADYRNGQGPKPRRDLELDALVEILQSRRFVHCHSYRQDEILMLIRLAESFGFKIGTFQHVLEGYKVAAEIAAHGACASTFSDWWAYKFEVYDAIPFNGALLHRAGVVTSFNSDSDELARRLNWEAAKAVKYGGLSPADAFAFVTINPAKQLRIDHRVGSLEAGKDADFVIWSGSPLSTYSRCLETWIEGSREFSLEEDRQLRQRDNERRRAIIAKLDGAQASPSFKDGNGRTGFIEESSHVRGECGCLSSHN